MCIRDSVLIARVPEWGCIRMAIAQLHRDLCADRSMAQRVLNHAGRHWRSVHIDSDSRSLAGAIVCKKHMLPIAAHSQGTVSYTHLDVYKRQRPIQVPCRLGFLAEIRKLGYGCLHPEGHLVLRDPRVSLRISHLRKCLQVDLLNSIQHFAAHLAIHAIRIAQKEHRIPTRSQADPCILRRKESTAPQPR